jgi:Holliday junction resolvase RusA-like endonuclease
MLKGVTMPVEGYKPIKTTIYIKPVPKGRPRVTKRGITYTPTKTRDAQIDIRNSWIVQFGDQCMFKDMPLKVKAVFYRERPKSTSKKIQLPLSRPDCNNYFSLLADSLNGYCWHDDACITTFTALKRFGDPPRIELEIEVDKSL